MLDALTRSRIEVRRVGGTAYLFVPASQVDAVGALLRGACVAYEVPPDQAGGIGAVQVTLIGGDVDLRRAQDALDRVS